MDDIGCRWTVWEGNGKTPGLKTDARAATIGPVPWPAGDIGEDDKEVLTFRQAITQTDWDTVEGHGGFDVVMEKVDHWEQEDPASNGRERIDDFRLAGSRTWRRRGVRLTNVGPDTLAGHEFNDHNASLSEGEALAVVVERFSETPHRKRDNTDFPRPLRPSEARLRLGWPPPAGCGDVAQERGAGGGSDPGLFAADAPREGARPDRPPDTLPPSFRGRSHHSDPWREGHRAPFRAHGGCVCLRVAL